MLRIVNHNEGIIISCPFVCGTTFLHRYVLYKDENQHDYEHIRGNWIIPEHYKIVRVVRNPIKRFYSWYNKFFIENKTWFDDHTNKFYTTKITDNTIDRFFTRFNVVAHYDNHVGLQKYLHITDPRFLIKNITYIDSSYLQVFLGIKNTPYVEKDRTVPCQEKVDKYLYKFYEEDLNWMNSLEIVK